MNKKVIGVIVCFFILTAGVITASSNSLKDIVKQVNQELIKNNDLGNNTTSDFYLYTQASVLKMYTSIEFLSEPDNATDFVNKCLKRKAPFKARILPFYPVMLKNANFVIYYKKDIRNNKSRFSYNTYFLEMKKNDAINESKNEDGNNFTIINNKVTHIAVTNFTGVFIYFHSGLFKSISTCPRKFLVPKTFLLTGLCDNIEHVKNIL